MEINRLRHGRAVKIISDGYNSIVIGHSSYSAKAVIGCLFIPSHKWDGNEVNKFIAVGFNQRIKRLLIR
jgi:hypothetical protein